MTSVVAPWAHAENYEALLRTKIAIEGQIESLELAKKANLDKTDSLLDRLEKRLLLQKSATDREISAPKDFSANNLLDGCKSYEFQNPEAEVLYSFGN